MTATITERAQSLIDYANEKRETNYDNLTDIISNELEGDQREVTNIPTASVVERAQSLIDYANDICCSDHNDLTEVILHELKGQRTYSVEEQEPYLFRKSGGSAVIGTREKDTIVGGTIVWNQIAINGNFANKATWNVYKANYSASNNEATITNSDTNGSIFQNIGVITGHKYIYIVHVKTGTASSVRATFAGTTIGETTSTSYEVVSKVISISETASRMFEISVRGTAGQTGFAKNAMFIDLTQMFGSTIADAIYAMEQASAGAGVAWFRSLFPKPYYSYDAGTLMHVGGLKSHDTVGFNQWDEEWEKGRYDVTNGAKEPTTETRICSKNPIKCTPDTRYYYSCNTGLYTGNLDVLFYDADGNYIDHFNFNSNHLFTTPINCYYMNFYTGMAYGEIYKNDICFNISDSVKNGTYEPYHKHSYPLDSSLTIRGVPKLDSGNRMYYDGDTYESDGTVTRKYGIRAYQSGDESLTDAITDGTNTVYKLNTPTTETANSYATPQIVHKEGTEEYVCETDADVIIPVGHDTLYSIE